MKKIAQMRIHEHVMRKVVVLSEPVLKLTLIINLIMLPLSQYTPHENTFSESEPQGGEIEQF